MTTGGSEPAYDKSVFINCPFDEGYRDQRLAILFTVTAHGYKARSALETEGLSELRMSKIIETLGACKYSIHDLSRYTGEGMDNHARFNMPLELGMAIALRSERNGSNRPHNWLALVPEGYVHLSFISDLAGYDPGRHDGAPSSIIREVSAWLRAQNDELLTAPSASRIDASFPDFLRRADELRTSALGKESWANLIIAAGNSLLVE